MVSLTQMNIYISDLSRENFIKHLTLFIKDKNMCEMRYLKVWNN